MGKVSVIDHPLVQHKLSVLRDRRTGTKEFRELIYEMSIMLGYEATRGLALEDAVVETPLATANVKVLSDKKLGIVPILRAGLGMVDGITSLLPSAKVGHIGLYRDPATLKPIDYYCKLPDDICERDVIVMDPMLATGGSATAAIGVLKRAGCKNIKLMCIIAAPEGLKAVLESHNDVDVFLACVDERLNEHVFIIPGLGYAGDSLFWTR